MVQVKESYIWVAYELFHHEYLCKIIMCLNLQMNQYLALAALGTAFLMHARYQLLR